MKKLEIKNFHLNILILLILSFIILKNFSIIPNHYTLNYIFYTNRDFFSESYLNSSIFFKNPLYYELFKFLNFDLDNTLNQFLLHTLLKTLNIIFLFLIIKNFFSFQKNYFIFLFIIIVATKKDLVIDGTHSSWAFTHITNPSDLGYTLNLAILYFILKRGVFWLILITIMALFNSIKSSWFISLIVMSSIFLNEKGIKKFFFFFIFLALIYLFTKDFTIIQNQNDKYELYKYTYLTELSSGDCEAVFDCKNPIRIFFLILSFVIFYFINKKTINIKLKTTFNLILFFSVAIFLSYKIKDFLNFEIFKFWQIIALSPVRALAIYEVCFFLLITSNLLKLKNSLYSLLILLSFIFFGWGVKGYIISFCFILVYIIIKYLNLYKNFFLKEKKFIFFFFILILPSFFYLMVNSFVKEKKINVSYFVLEKNFFYNFDKNHYNALIKIQLCRDFKFEDFLNQNTKIKSNLLAKKSPFFYDSAHFYGNINLIRTNQKNRYLLKELYSNYKNNIKTDLSESNISDLAILVPTEKEMLFFGDYQKIKINNEFTLILINYKKENLITQCFE